MNAEPIYALSDIEAAIEALHRLHESRTFILDYPSASQLRTDKTVVDRVTENGHFTRTLAVRHRFLVQCVFLAELSR